MQHRRHFASISAYFAAAGLAAPCHPLFAIRQLGQIGGRRPQAQPLYAQTLSGDFYLISLKQLASGELFYGKTRYDCDSGTMLFMAPNQQMRAQGVRIDAEGWVMLIHEDFLLNHPVKGLIRQSGFFDYATDEALHLSATEQQHISAIFHAMENEYRGRYDAQTKAIVLSQLTSLLCYAERFYQRQFIQRQDTMVSLSTRLYRLLDAWLAQADTQGLPEVSTLAAALNMTPRYLTDALKTENGKSAKALVQGYLIDKAKERLLQTDATVASVAYSLGYEYPQYFARLFRKKAGMSPTEFRKHHH